MVNSNTAAAATKINEGGVTAFLVSQKNDGLRSTRTGFYRVFLG
jgi:hypothetical protein